MRARALMLAALAALALAGCGVKGDPITPAEARAEQKDAP